MKIFPYTVILCSLGALAMPISGAAQTLPQPGTAQTNYKGAIPPEAVQAVNAYLAAIGAQDVEGSARIAYFKTPEERAFFVENFKKLLSSQTQTVTWQGVRLRAVEPLSQGGFLVKYELELQKGAGAVSLERNDEVREIDGVWKVIPTRLFAMSNAALSDDEANRSPLLSKVSKTAGATHYVLDKALTRSQPIPSGEGISPADAARQLPLLETARDIIQSMQAPLMEKESARMFLFGFKKTGNQLSLLSAMPVAGETGENLPFYVMDDDTTITYQVTEKDKRDADLFSFALAFAWRLHEQPGLLETRVLDPRPILLAEDTLYPAELPPDWRNPQRPKGFDFVFVLAHLPLTENCVIQARNAAPQKLQDAQAQAKQNNALPPL